MPRRPKGPRLYLRQGRRHSRTGERLPDVWVIRDGAEERSTGCPAEGLPDAERALADYIAAKWAPPPGPAAGGRPRDPAEILIADVLALYAAERAPELADPVSVAGRLKALDAWWAGRSCAEITRSHCKAYVAHRAAMPRRHATKGAPHERRLVTEQGARRELEDLSAALGWWHREHPFTARPQVTLPEKPESPRDALTRPQAAALVKAARGFRLGPDGRWTRLPTLTRQRRAHMPRLILIGLYNGARPGVITRLLWTESPRQAWVDLAKGMIWRRGKLEREIRTKRRPVARLPQRLAGHLRRWHRQDETLNAARAEAASKARQDPPAPIASVIHYAGRGGIVARADNSFAAIVADAGLPSEITPHWLRHTAATWLMEGGVDLWEASAYMGMTPDTLQRVYGHHRPDYQAQAAGSNRRRQG